MKGTVKVRGKVKFAVADRDYLLPSALRYLKDGDKIEFKPIKGKRGYKASEVTLCGEN